MSKFNAARNSSASSRRPNTTTHEGGSAYSLADCEALFLLAVTNMVSEDTFYESAAQRDKRYVDLIHKVTAANPTFIQKFAPYLRKDAGMRSASIVLAAEYIAAGGPSGRMVVDAVCQRPDEPAEILSYWLANYRNRPIPYALKRGVADACRRLYTEKNVIKYDGQGKAMRFADVLNLVHPKPVDEKQAEVFKWILGRANRPFAEITGLNLNVLKMASADNRLLSMPEQYRRGTSTDSLAEAGWTWERLAGWLPGGMDKEAWERIIPQMKYMGLVRNLRNFEQAGINKATVEYVRKQVSDPALVRSSGIFPYQVCLAAKNVNSHQFASALGDALDNSCSNVPKFDGRTLILIDTSGSMQQGRVSEKSDITACEIAAVFAAAVRANNPDADLVSFATTSTNLQIPAGSSTMTIHARLISHSNKDGMGTNIADALKKHLKPEHKRVIIISDMQCANRVHFAPRRDLFIHSFDVAGYGNSKFDPKNPRLFLWGGFSDASFAAMRGAEMAKSGEAAWPFLK